jgi:peptidoglycan/LPS O-acetylase OafA/YrhL
LTIALVLLNVRLGSADESQTALVRWISYHIVSIPLYAFLTYRLAYGSGLVCRLLSIRVVREIGRSSFYPYLMHIPLISWLTWVLETYFKYNTFLHSNWNILLFIVLLYAGTTFYSMKVKRVVRQKYAKLSE